MDNPRDDENRTNDEAQEEIVLDALLKNIVYYNQESTFLVGRFEINGEAELRSATGEMLFPTPGERYVLNGKWVRHKKYGLQFSFSSYETPLPVTKEGIEQYLSSGLIKGIGQSFAHRIVQRFGKETLDIMNTDIERLLEVSGIGAKKFVSIKESWDEQRGVQNVMFFLKSHGVGTSYSVRIFKTYGERAIEVMNKNPYRLIDDVEGIGFITADKIAFKLGVDPEDAGRLKAGLLYVLREAARSKGHTFLPEAECVGDAIRMLHADEAAVRIALRMAVDEAFVVESEGRIFIPELFYAEHLIADCLRNLFFRQRAQPDYPRLNRELAVVEHQYNIRFTPIQTEAMNRSIAGPVTIITGGPGTGKTTTVLGIIGIARALDWKVAVCAPTGRAAKRLTELTRFESKTIHRLLEYDPRSNFFKRNEDAPLEIDLLIVDEMSMVDVSLFAALLRAVPERARVVLMGDADQLPPVGPGDSLRDCINSKQIETIVLNTIFRQAEHSSIISNAHRARNGAPPLYDYDTVLVEASDNEEIAGIVCRMVVHTLPGELHIDPVRQIQVLTPMHNTPAGVKNLNLLLQAALNPLQRPLFHRGDHAWHIGDKVMQTRNNYEKDVFNGDIGIVESYDEDEGVLAIRFDDRPVSFKMEELDNMMLAYATTIHKSQGSEYDVVVIPVTLQHRIMLQRNLIYTAMTRAKRKLVFVGQKAALTFAVQNERVVVRYSSLSELLVEKLR